MGKDGCRCQEGGNGRTELCLYGLVKKAYRYDLGLLVAGLRYPGEDADKAHQAYLDFSGGRFLVCYTSKKHAWNHRKKGLEVDSGVEFTAVAVSARDVLNNLFHKASVFGLVFNPEDEKMGIILKDLLEKIITGEKPKPPFFVDAKD